ncbi:GNAT family N-acetyltransferase [Bacillus atrophaeus]|uniref:GNAT family N-acetyltransferase n=1 Tax=Bacillus atrophaeus TaxID=1452 RepID=UPI003873945B
MIEIKRLTKKEEWKEAFPVMHELRTHIDEPTFLERIERCIKQESYTLFALYDHGTITALCGALPRVSLHKGEYVWVADLVTSEHNRSKGYGKQLLEHVCKWAKEAGYDTISLSSGVQRVDAHRFYQEKSGFTIESYLFRKSL